MFLHTVLVHIVFVVMPICSIVMYCIFFEENTRDDNIIRTWLLVYPLNGCFFLFYYLKWVSGLLSELK